MLAGDWECQNLCCETRPFDVSQNKHLCADSLSLRIFYSSSEAQNRNDSANIASAANNKGQIDGEASKGFYRHLWESTKLDPLDFR